MCTKQRNFKRELHDMKEWNHEKGYLTDTCLTAQDKYTEL